MLRLRRPRRRRATAAAATLCCAMLLLGDRVGPLSEQMLWQWGKAHPGMHHLLEDAFSTAGIYYRRQRPFFVAASKTWQTGWYWAGIDLSGVTVDTAEYDDMVVRRFRRERALFDLYRRDDFRTEKDKCEMIRFLEQNDLPTMETLGMWYSKGNMSNLIVDTALAKGDEQRWPLFVKTCHITSKEKGLLRLKSRDWAKEHTTEIQRWVDGKFAVKFNDEGRDWVEDNNYLCATLLPGIVLQAPALFSPIPENPGETRIFEMKVEMVWGRLYLGEIVANNFPFGLMVIRNPASTEEKTEWEVHASRGISSLLNLHRWLPRSLFPVYPPGLNWDWVLEERHMDCIETLATKVARAMTIEQVRVDIFFNKGNPGGCMVNEISLSSGSHTYSHRRNVAKVWAEGHLLRRKESIPPQGDEHSVPTYMQTAPTYMQTAPTYMQQT